MQDTSIDRHMPKPKMTEAQAWQELESHLNMMLCAAKTHNLESVLAQNLAINNPIGVLLVVKEKREQVEEKLAGIPA